MPSTAVRISLRSVAARPVLSPLYLLILLMSLSLSLSLSSSLLSLPALHYILLSSRSILLGKVYNNIISIL
jgi:hypothetical protein